MQAEHPTWGGRRAGAGRPRKPPLLLDCLPATTDPRQWLAALMECEAAPMRLRAEAAKMLMRAGAGAG